MYNRLPLLHNPQYLYHSHMFIEVCVGVVPCMRGDYFSLILVLSSTSLFSPMWHLRACVWMPIVFALMLSDQLKRCVDKMSYKVAF